MSDERSPLHWAVMNNDLAEINAQLANGADVDAADESGWTPLITAASAGYSHIADRLLQAGADAHLTTREGRSAFFYAVSRCKVPVIDLFIQNDLQDWKKDKLGFNAVHRALCNTACTEDLLQMLQNAEAPFSVADPEGNLPIHIACYENRRDLAKWLVEHTGADLDRPKNADGKTPRQLFPSAEFNA